MLRPHDSWSLKTLDKVFLWSYSMFLNTGLLLCAYWVFSVSLLIMLHTLSSLCPVPLIIYMLTVYIFKRKHSEKSPICPSNTEDIFKYCSFNILLPMKEQAKLCHLARARAAYINHKSTSTNTLWLQKSRESLEVISHYQNEKVVSVEVLNSINFKTGQNDAN